MSKPWLLPNYQPTYLYLYIYMQSADLHSFSLLWPLSKSWVDTLRSMRRLAPSAGF